ncbi:polysaccharide biosynthesis/export family protein [Terracidiphilus gabretensis]|uniref:polysaccharide biosynthesis/export family protein n=1 Tax=Terracidiphilus gabretensis TaxID=1577687 RepID=UPI00071BDB6A|nr:polysaccharide biosynthesis/export family protein [Terracidiphilus gabretensis]
MLKKPHLYVLAALLPLLGLPASFSQNSTPNGYPNGYPSDEQSPYSSSDCADPADIANGTCAQNQQGSQQQPNLQQQIRGQQPGLQGPQTLGVPGQESAGQGNLLGQQGNRNRQTQQLPPDQPTEFQRFVAATTGQMLPIYGANLFRNVPTTFSPNDLAPATPEYVIEPDDELRVRIWGQINYTGNLLVDRSGNIYLPQVGQVHVAGQPFSALDLHLRQAVGKIFRNFDLSVDLGRIRQMQIYVTGVARRPGVYTISAVSTLVDALFASGGPAPQGSLRHIELKRAGKTVADFDLYALLIHGDKSQDVRLLPEDVLYVPPAGPQAAITGSIRAPAIYELREGDTLGALIEAAGKTSTTASQTRISIERVDNHQYRQAMEASFDVAGLATPLAEGDIVRIYPIVPAYQKTVILRGNVANPGRFGWHEGMHLSDLIPDRASLLSREYWWQRSLLGLPAPEFEPFISTQRSPTGTEPIPLRDSTGRVQNPQNAINSPYGLYGPYGLQSNSQNYPQNYQQSSPQNYPQGVLPDDLQNNQQPGSARQGSMGGSGSVAAQISHGLMPVEEPTIKRNTVRLTPQEINWDYAVIERRDPNTMRTSLVAFDLGKLVLEHDATQNLALEQGDTVTIFSQSDIQVPLDEQTKYVDLEGEFVHSGIYSVKPGETLRDVARRAGGLTKNAYLYGSEFDRESTRKLQQQRLDEYVQTVSTESNRGTQQLAVAGSGASNSLDVAASREVTQELIGRLSQIRATGRIVLQFKAVNQTIEDVPALALENGDRFTVPATPATINIVGAVYNQNSFVYQGGQTVGHYLRLAGGPNRNADSHYSFIIRADGSVVSRPTVRKTFGALSASTFDQLQLNPGDTIVVPDKTLRMTKLRTFMDWTQIFSQLALGAAAINVL